MGCRKQNATVPVSGGAIHGTVGCQKTEVSFFSVDPVRDQSTWRPHFRSFWLGFEQAVVALIRIFPASIPQDQ